MTDSSAARFQIHNTSAYPWRPHASLLITAPDRSSWIGTGWFIGPCTLCPATVTAANDTFAITAPAEGYSIHYPRRRAK